MKVSVAVLLALIAASHAAIVLVACGSSYGENGHAPAGSDEDANADGGVDRAEPSRTPEDAGPCDTTKPFGTAVPLDGLGARTQNDEGARFSPDELTIYFHSDRGDASDGDLYSSTRSSLEKPFDPPTFLAASSADYDGYPTTSGDGNTLIFERQASDGNRDLLQTTRPSPAVEFATARRLIGPVTTPGFEGQPFLRPDGKVLYFITSRTDGSLDIDIHRATLVDGAFTDAKPVTELNTPGFEYAPVVTKDDLTIFWARGSKSMKEGLTMFTASRATPDAAFSNIRSLDELNTSRKNSPTWISGDGCRLYFASDRLLARTSIFVATRAR